MSSRDKRPGELVCTANAKGRILYMSQAYRIWFKKKEKRYDSFEHRSGNAGSVFKGRG